LRINNLDQATLDSIQKLVDSKVSWIGRRYSLQYADQEDIRQEGMLVALESLKHHKARQGSLSTFLTPRITFAMLSHMFSNMEHGLTGGHTGGFEMLDISEVLKEDDDGADRLRMGHDEEALTFDEESLESDDLRSALSKLPTVQSNLLSKYFGLVGERPMTMRQLAHRGKVSDATIFRRLSDALKALKSLLDSNA
jgi:RNA polymerase sigma factor (sigma-70 family)